jgi:hypothetical protein
VIRRTEFREKLWYLYGLRLENLVPGKRLYIGFRKYCTMGTGVEVSMNFDTAKSSQIIGWYHTHPGEKNITPSITDNSTMRSWVKAAYKSYLCGIQCGDSEAVYCYYLGGISREKTTVVKKEKIKFSLFGPLFLGILKVNN